MVEADSFEYVGKCMYDAACRPKKTYQLQIVSAEQNAKRKGSSEAARQMHSNRAAELRRELYHCEYGCTPPRGQAVRAVPERRPARSDLDIDRDRIILGLQAELNEERQKAVSAKREQERADRAQVDAAIQVGLHLLARRPRRVMARDAERSHTP